MTNDRVMLSAEYYVIAYLIIWQQTLEADVGRKLNYRTSVANQSKRRCLYVRCACFHESTSRHNLAMLRYPNIIRARITFESSVLTYTPDHDIRDRWSIKHSRQTCDQILYVYMIYIYIYIYMLHSVPMSSFQSWAGLQITASSSWCWNAFIHEQVLEISRSFFGDEVLHCPWPCRRCDNMDVSTKAWGPECCIGSVMSASDAKSFNCSVSWRQGA